MSTVVRVRNDLLEKCKKLNPQLENEKAPEVVKFSLLDYIKLKEVKDTA